MIRHAVLVGCSLWLAASAAAAARLPEWFPPERSFSTNPDNTIYEDYGRGVFAIAKGGAATELTVLGKHWHADLYPPKGSDAWNGQQVWAGLRSALERSGYKVVYLSSGGVTQATLRRDAGATTTYIALTITDSDGFSNSVEIVETGASALVVTLTPPAAKPEKFGEADDFPYLTPLQGSRRADTAPEPDYTPLDVTTPSDKEPHFVGSMHSIKNYEGPSGLSNLAFVNAYADALGKAGWTVVQRSEGQDQGSGIVVAHFDKNGRDVWLSLASGGSAWRASAADIGQGLRSGLAAACKVPVYGVNFDFDKATLRADAEPVLQQVLGVFRSDAALKAEVGGHTDNVGKPDYNQKLSAGRADAVRQWLVGHGVATDRVTARGYGDTAPVAPNDSDSNRARNRRVELKKPGCS